jgi:hypothetical protein
LIAFLAVNGACTGGTSSTTPSPPTSTTLSVALTTTLASTTTTTPPETTTTLALPEEPRVSGGWSLQQGDYLVSNAQGVVVVRDGVNVAQPVTSPVESALAEGTGAIIFVTPDPELFPRHWPARGQGGGYTIWRVQPDGTLTPVLRTDFTIDGPLGAITLYQAPMIGVITDGFTTPILKVARSDSRENVVLAPAGNFNGVFGGLAMRLVGVITGVGWQESASRLIVSFNSDGGGWLEAWNFDDTPPVHWPSEWPTNPVPPDTPCPDDDGFNHCLGSVTTLPGTTLIAYTETDAWRTATSLIIYDTEAGKELTRVLVAEEPTFVKQLHASDTEVAVSLATYRDLRYQYLPTIVIEVGTGEQRSLPAGGVTTIVP